MNRNAFVSFFGAFVVGAAAFSTSVALATTRYIAARECQRDPQYGGIISGTYGQIANDDSNNLSGDMSLYCPVFNGTDFNLSSSSVAKVAGYEHCAGDDILFQACTTYLAGGGGKCTGSTTPNTACHTFNKSIGDMTDSGWTLNNPNGDFYFVYVQLGFQVSSSDDALFGITVTN